MIQICFWYLVQVEQMLGMCFFFIVQNLGLVFGVILVFWIWFFVFIKIIYGRMGVVVVIFFLYNVMEYLQNGKGGKD